MAADRKLIVAVVGDDSSLQATLKRSAAAVGKFKQVADKSLGRGISTRSTFEPLLADIRKTRAEGERLQEEFARTERTATDMALAGAKVAGGLFAAGRAAEGAGAALAAFQGHTSKASRALTDAGDAITSLVTLNPAGFFKALGAAAERTREALSKYAAGLTDVNQSTVALQIAQGAAALGFDKQADAIIKQVAALKSAQTATEAMDFGLRDFNQTVIDGTNFLVAYKGAHDAAFGGGIPVFGNTPATAPPTPGMKTLPAMSPSQRRELDLIAAQGTEKLPLLQDRLRQLSNQLADFHGNQEQRLRLATRVKTTEQEIAQVYKDQAAATKAADQAAAALAKQRADEAKRRAREAADRARQAKLAKKAAEQARQFRALGLDAFGGKPPPTIATLLKQITQVSGRDDLSKNQRGVLARVRKTLIDPLHKATPETRDAAKGLIQAIRDGFKDELGKGPLTKTTSLNAGKLLEGLGLGRDMEKELRARLSSFNSAGRALSGAQTRATGQFRGGTEAQPITVNTYLDGQLVASNTTKHQQKTKRRNPTQKRGPRRGGV